MVGVIMALMLTFLGNPVLLAFVSVKIVFSNDLVTALTPLNRPTIKRTRPFETFILSFIAMLVGAVYFAVLVYALATETISLGWIYIKGDPWSYVSFIDNMLGIAFTCVFVALRERESKFVIVWIVSLLLLGNGITCIYVYLCCRGDHSIREVVLCKILETRETVRLNLSDEDSE